MLMLGLRSGEARGLRWCDVDFQNNVVSVEKNVGDTFNGLALTELKTKRSRRKLPLSPVLREILLKHKAVQDEQARKLGSAWQDNGLICPNLTGGLMDKATPNKAVKRILKERKDLPQNLHAHSLRHPYVKLKLKILSAYFSRTFGAKVLDFPHDFNPVIGIYTHLFDKHIGKCLR